jgi:release factor glutamine methyltransferase
VKTRRKIKQTDLFLRMDLQQAQRQLITDLTPLYGTREGGLITDWVLEHLTGLQRIDRLVRASEPLSASILGQYESFRNQLLAHRPVQYVLHESWFAGLKFYVDETVLIPRPETEELVEWVLQTINFPSGALLDVGTGSGCIPIAIASQLPTLPIHACDISKGALDVAKRNAKTHNTSIQFHHLDFLDRQAWTTLPSVQWLISNPPYIPLNEKSTLAPHVAGAEPSLALFVPDADPLVFYRALAEFARQQLLPGGSIFVEIHENLSSGTLEVFKTAGFQQVILRKDMQGRDRMIRASRAPAELRA